jgi:hypothetical protein
MQMKASIETSYRIPRRSELRRIISNARQRERAIILLAVSGGLKMSQIRRLKFWIIDLALLGVQDH